MAFATINSVPPTHAPQTHARIQIPAIEDAFAAEPALKKRVYDAIGSTPQHAPLFEDIARYTSSQRTRIAGNPVQSLHNVQVVHEGPAAKKRKIENGAGTGGNAQSLAELKTHGELQFYMQDVSFTIPQRKKLMLEITAGKKYLRARNQASKEVEFGVSMDRIQHVLCLPVPEKNQRQFNFCIIPRYADGINTAPDGEPTPETIVWTVNDGPPKAAFSEFGQQIGNGEGETAENLVRRVLNDNLSQVRVVRPDAQEFVSAMPEAHRKGEKAYHVKAFRGSKEGYLFFLCTGIFFGFKKPLLFFGLETIESISYTSVLQRTFNLNITARAVGSEETQEFEFSMIDQADYSGIDSYIKTHGLQDASLAEARRAKHYNINGVKTEENVDGDAQGAEEGELQKAQRKLEDREDEEEEDYDPGSEGDSDGSGSSSEEDEDQDQDEGDGAGDRDLVADELGSEAEDVPEDEL
ncbi:putative negative regulator of DNA transposition (Rtt106) [Aspergillus lucknowensis]|uniref:Histone chaperone RTT106/FACT complex subunit SPT16-like middle domain-containing protein n=1 Tax=Aspergillus lucknowensis TaxID=176173 RepID=A0ABR4LJ95_9EURO